MSRMWGALCVLLCVTTCFGHDRLMSGGDRSDEMPEPGEKLCLKWSVLAKLTLPLSYFVLAVIGGLSRASKHCKTPGRNCASSNNSSIGAPTSVKHWEIPLTKMFCITALLKSSAAASHF
jgi:hypothetical protein